MYYEKAISFKELYRGLRLSARNVKWKDSVAIYYVNGLKHTYRLRQNLLNGRYKIDQYQRFMIYEPKVREIVATRIKDRQFQRALTDNVLYPQITHGFIRDNIACQKGKGVDDALNRMDAHLHRYYRKHGCEGWVLKCDIRHYFAETRHDVAKAAIRKRVTDDEAYARAAEIIDSFGGDKGIGLGSQVSQLVELAVLDDFDHWIKERLRVKHYIRYMDDFVLIHEEKDFLRHALKLIADKLSVLGLTLNDKTNIYPLRQGVKFLKWRFVLTASGRVLRRMSRKAVTKEKRKLRRMARKAVAPLPCLAGATSSRESFGFQRDAAGTCAKSYGSGACKGASEKAMRESLDSWIANARRGDTYGVVIEMERYFEEVCKHG